MQRVWGSTAWLVGLALVAGCASTKVTDSDRYDGDRIARPDRIIIYDFAATPDDLPGWSAAAAQFSRSDIVPDPEAVAAGRELGRAVSTQLAEEIRDMGLPGVRAAETAAPRVGDIVIVGYFEAIDQGSTAKRLMLGFGSGNADVKTYAEGYLATDRGMRKLGSGSIDAGGGKAPGVAVPLAVTIATANPIGLVVGGAIKAKGEITGSSKIEGAAKRTAEQIAERLQEGFKKQGWI